MKEAGTEGRERERERPIGWERGKEGGKEGRQCFQLVCPKTGIAQIPQRGTPKFCIMGSIYFSYSCGHIELSCCQWNAELMIDAG